MNIETFLRKAGENFYLSRESERIRVEGIKQRKGREIHFRPKADVRLGDWLTDESGKRFYVQDTDVQVGFERQPFRLIAAYQTEAEYEAAQTPGVPTTNVTFNVGSAYGSIFGTQQHAEMNNVSFEFSTVQAELDKAEEEIERRGGPDAAELKELIAEVRKLHENGEPLDRGWLAKYLGVIQRNGWIAAPIAGTLLSILTGA